MKFKALLYCEKKKPYLYHDEDYCYDTMNTIDLGYKTFEYTNQRVYDDETGKFLGWENYDYWYNEHTLNGKIVIECDFEVEEIEKGYGTHHASFDKDGYFDDYCDYMTKTIDEDILLKRSCLNVEELETYNPNYAIHIKNLKIFDEPKELSEYYSIIDMGGGMLGTKPLTNAPKNMMRISVNHWEYCFYNPSDITILIPVTSEEMCRIANKEQTILIRKRVLKEMIK